MADEKLQSSGDLRLKLAAHAIRHEQQGEIALMNGLKGWEPVQTAIRNMLPIMSTDDAAGSSG